MLDTYGLLALSLTRSLVSIDVILNGLENNELISDSRASSYPGLFLTSSIVTTLPCNLFNSWIVDSVNPPKLLLTASAAPLESK
jgi:hypothetical protein